MSVSRRSFLKNSTIAGAGLLVAGAVEPGLAVADEEPGVSIAQYLSGMRMAATPASAYRAYRSKVVGNPDTTMWIQIDLGQTIPVDFVLLYPASERMFPGRDQYYAGEGFPLRFKIETANDPEFSNPGMGTDLTRSDFPDCGDNIMKFTARGHHARYVRLTVTRLRAVKILPGSGSPDENLDDSPDYSLRLGRIGVLTSGEDVAAGSTLTADPEHGNPELLKQLIRPPRQDGETIKFDHPNLVTDPSTWKRVPFKVQAPRSGITLDGGIFQAALQHNAQYLLNSYTTEDLLRQFYERSGKVSGFKPVGSQVFWEEDLAGSNAGRFLMGAGNTVRWLEDAELRKRLNAVVDGIEECRKANGYIMAYQEDTIFYSERAAYTRAWLTHGLLEAAYAGNLKALPLLRGYYDWFNEQSFLPEMLRGAIQGGQGMIANTRVALSPVGKPADGQVIQRYYQENAWLEGLAKRDKEQIWQYPYDRPHCYLLTDIEAYMDMYLLTGEKRYFDAAQGAWEMYRAHWQQAGGSISIIEFENDPPDSNYLKQKLGELCGSSFWVFLSQRFQLLDPENEQYAAEIEKSIYNVGLANQDGGNGFRYHTVLEGEKEKATHENTCCEGQGTRLIGSLPEHIFSLASDGLYLHLYEASTVKWQQDGQEMTLAVRTQFPFDNFVEATIHAPAATQARIRVRVPSWAISQMGVSVNDKVAASGKPGSYVLLDRQWSEGDKITFSLPAGVRVTRYKGADQVSGKERYAIEYGPVLLAALGEGVVDLALDKGSDPESLGRHLDSIAGAPLHYMLRENPARKLMPYFQVADEFFTCYPVITVRT
ncbi:MAG TPA: beta-L-arabinofuranosidase domain-containing protein [Terracidiphilus sp.]